MGERVFWEATREYAAARPQIISLHERRAGAWRGERARAGPSGSQACRLMSLRSRLAKLSHAQLLKFAAETCESSPELKNKADALIAQVAPLPAWCVDILMSPDLLPQLFSSLGISEHAAAGVCSTWSDAYRRQLRRCCYINPTRVRQLADVPEQPNGLCVLRGGVLAIASGDDRDGFSTMKFIAARGDTDPQALAACRASSLAAQRFNWLVGMALTHDGLLSCNMYERSAALYKFAVDGAMDELATAPPLAEYPEGFSRCAVHQQTQRTFAIGVSTHVIILDSHLQVVATAEAAAATEGGISFNDVAIHGDQVIILTTSNHAQGRGLRLLDLDGRFLRTIAAGQFRWPQAVAASGGMAFVIDDYGEEDEEDEDDNEALWTAVLHVIEIHSGDIVQTEHLELSGRGISSIIVDGDEIYIADFYASKVIALRFAGSEA